MRVHAVSSAKVYRAMECLRFVHDEEIETLIYLFIYSFSEAGSCCVTQADPNPPASVS